jgi:hypothetical protein
MEPCKVCLSVVADLHHFNEEQDPDLRQRDADSQHFAGLYGPWLQNFGYGTVLKGKVAYLG